MIKFYNVSFDHQIEPQDFGSYSTLEKAEKILEDMDIDISKPRVYSRGTIRIYGSIQGDYLIEEKIIH